LRCELGQGFLFGEAVKGLEARKQHFLPTSFVAK
jgi:hypothetical protein